MDDTLLIIFIFLNTGSLKTCVRWYFFKVVEKRDDFYKPIAVL